ncbi:hypothetical protein HDU79_002721 [Rhizoclosmatium sp. JEL0117]|nr:hypothetical protein HDU79_002721 [Rhizoclosmatium sp. JEL0117]
MAYDGMREYMAAKMDKQQRQNESYGSGTASTILKDTVFWFDGWLGPDFSLLDMKTLCIKHGGTVQDMLTTRCTHIIAVSLTDRKIELWKNRRIVDPQWIHDSIKAGKLLSWQKYGIIQKSSASLFAPLNSSPNKPFAFTSSSSSAATSSKSLIPQNVSDIPEKSVSLRKPPAIPQASSASASSMNSLISSSSASSFAQKQTLSSTSFAAQKPPPNPKPSFPTVAPSTPQKPQSKIDLPSQESPSPSRSILDIAMEIEQLKRTVGIGNTTPTMRLSASKRPVYSPHINNNSEPTTPTKAPTRNTSLQKTPVMPRTQRPATQSRIPPPPPPPINLQPSTSAQSLPPNRAPSIPLPVAQPVRSNVPPTGIGNREQTDFAIKNTTATSGFLSKYYQSSRLSKISNWKSDLRDYVIGLQEDQRRAEKAAAGPSNPRSRRGGAVVPAPAAPTERVIMHIDMDCFFASVALLSRPEYKSKPVVICHSKGTGGNFESSTSDSPPAKGTNSYSTSEIASCNYVARKYGIKNGMLLGRAQQLLSSSPDAISAGHTAIIALPYEFEKYDSISKTLYAILVQECDEIQVVSCDEAYIDVSKRVATSGVSALDIAGLIRGRVERETGGCCASIGIGDCMLVARVATKKAKPDGVFWVQRGEVEAYFEGLNVGDLPGVGYVLGKQMDEIGVKTCGELRAISVGECKKLFGDVNGQKLYQFCRGIDTRPLENKTRQSVGAEVNWGVRFQTMDEAYAFVRELSQEVHQRMEKSGVQGRHITVKVKKKLYDGEPTKFLGCGHCLDLSKSKTLEASVIDEDRLYREALALFKELGVGALDLRGVGIHVSKLVNKSANMKGQTLLKFTTKRKSVDAELDQETDELGLVEPAKRARVEEPDRASLFQSASQIDWSMVDGLPEEIRAELMALKKPANKAQPQPVVPQPRRGSIPKCAPLTLDRIFVAKPAPVPTLLGRSSFSDVKQLLNDWLYSTTEPIETDTLRFRKYLRALVHNWEGEKCLNLVKCFAEGVQLVRNNDKIWKEALVQIKEDVNSAFMVEYGHCANMIF